MKSFNEFKRDAMRYRALEATEKASPWKDVLGPHNHLASLADALLSVKEDAPAMSVGGGEGLAGLRGDPPVSKKAQKKWVRRNNIVRRKS